MINVIKENWDYILEKVKRESDITNVSFKTWLLPLDPVALQDGNLAVRGLDSFQIMYVSRKYGKPLEKVVSEVLKNPCRIQFQAADRENKMSQVNDSAADDEEYLLDQEEIAQPMENQLGELILAIRELNAGIGQLTAQLKMCKGEN